MTSVKDDLLNQSDEFSLLDTMRNRLEDKSLYTLDMCSEILLSPDDTLQVRVETNAQHKIPRKKAVLHHKASAYDLKTISVFCLCRVQDICPVCI